MPQRLVAAQRVRVVVGVALQLVEQQVRHGVVGVPAVPRVGAVAAVLAALALEPVVLEVVDDLQQREAHERLQDQPGQDHRPERDDERDEQHDGHRPGDADLVVEGRVAALGPALRLQVPRRAQAAPDRARQEHPEALAEPRARRVLRGRDADVVAAVVLDVEVPVGGARERDLRQPALDVLALVAQLVGGVDGDAADDAHGQRETEVRVPGQVPARPDPAREHEARVLDRDEQVGHPAVVAVGLEALALGLRRVVVGGTEDHVQRRKDHEEDHRADPPPAGPAGGGGQPRADERHRRHQGGQRPR